MVYMAITITIVTLVIQIAKVICFKRVIREKGGWFFVSSLKERRL
jgi:hypothetical protein